MITVVEGFSSGDIVKGASDDFTVERRYNDNGVVDEAIVDLMGIAFDMYDANGGAGVIGIREGSHMVLRQNFDANDSGDPEFSSDDLVLVASDSYLLAVLAPSGSYRGWGFTIVPEEQCPEGAMCFDLP